MKGLESHTKDSDFLFCGSWGATEPTYNGSNINTPQAPYYNSNNVLFPPLSRYEGSIKHVKGISKEKCMSLLTELSLEKGGQECTYSTVRVIIVCLKSSNLVGNL